MSEEKQITLTIDELGVVSSESIATNASASSLAKLFEGNVQSQLLNNQTAAATTATCVAYILTLGRSAETIWNPNNGPSVSVNQD
ncbi:MAG: hypothetical protein CMH90_03495 [Oceanicaulis sp.]|jgi:hypothetical protein|uniref:hypothetical protein n=1 Tax=Oceanicaulis TaxID=153232 RepID=UPI0003B3A219|nr:MULTISPECIES: hypothetical protein [Oceanicaulis]MAP48525.1 hypothetical protein [Oceanicaulis sp.]VXC80517.1 conserved hypothetical protein [Oceanicaulis sp. 350]HCR64992.1 hypothetical protein [Oceanicaulis sp.]|tara:strand:+ start:2508 stop:2762 length:255 start_codon:yes stop_codon:yes gene_type:complete